MVMTLSSEPAIVVQPVVRSNSDLARESLDGGGDGSDSHLCHRAPRRLAGQDERWPRLVEANQTDFTHASVLDCEVRAAPLHQVVQFIVGAVLPQDLGIVLGSLPAHLPLQRSGDQRGAARRLHE